MVFEFPNNQCYYRRSPEFIAWIEDEFHGGQKDKGAWMTIEAKSYGEAIGLFKRYVAYGKRIGAYL